jgi:hypothetical protein
VFKNSNLENGVTVQMNEFNLVVIKESAQKVVGREAKSVLEEGREHRNPWWQNSLASATNDWKRCECEAAMAGKKVHSSTKLELERRRRLKELVVEEGVIRFKTWSPF